MIEKKEGEEEKKYTFCSHCGAICTGKIDGKFICCKYCHLFSPIGAHSFYSLKGGNNEMATKKLATVVKKASKKLSPKVEGKSTEEVVTGVKNPKQVLAEQAMKVKEFMDLTFSQATKEEKLAINHQYWKLLKAE